MRSTSALGTMCQVWNPCFSFFVEITSSLIQLMIVSRLKLGRFSRHFFKATPKEINSFLDVFGIRTKLYKPTSIITTVSCHLDHGTLLLTSCIIHDICYSIKAQLRRILEDNDMMKAVKKMLNGLKRIFKATTYKSRRTGSVIVADNLFRAFETQTNLRVIGAFHVRPVTRRSMNVAARS